MWGIVWSTDIFKVFQKLTTKLSVNEIICQNGTDKMEIEDVSWPQIVSDTTICIDLCEAPSGQLNTMPTDGLLLQIASLQFLSHISTKKHSQLI